MNPGTRDVCLSGMCSASSCGDGFVDSGGGEDCEDGNSTNGDGCDNDCTYSCTSAGDCSDGLVCNGAESCNTTTHTCSAGSPPSDGTVCDRDMMSSTRDICLMASCVLSTCGDGYLDTGTTPAEECDDGNLVSGDGCEPDCTITGPGPTAFRFVTIRLRDPHFYVDAIWCQDLTDSAFLGFSVNGALQDSIDDYTLNYLTVHRPLDLAMSTNPMDVVIDGECMAATPDICQVGTGMSNPTTANNLAAGMTCYTPDSTTLNPGYMPPNTVSGPCFVSDPIDLTVNVSGIPIPLSDARVAATYSGGLPPTQLVTGVISGFLSEADAMSTILPGSLPLVGGDTLYQHLAAGGASGSSCEDGEDDRDSYMGTTGFWFYLDFTAELVDWSGP
jgi:cysteine-rich repeat protein